jgi:hypothetical protein
MQPLVEKKFNIAEPKIETVVLQANAAQANEKGLRVLVRNRIIVLWI